MSRRTIGKRWPRSAPRGDIQSMCDYCGVMWRRSQLRRDGAGLLVCPDEGDGRDSVTLDRLNAMGARRAPRNFNPDAGQYVSEADQSSQVYHNTGLDDIYSPNPWEPPPPPPPEGGAFSEDFSDDFDT
jgi:hypothetical protein